MPMPACRLACALALGNLLLSTVLLPLSLCQHIAASHRRHKYDFADDRPELIFDTHMMQDGREEEVYLFKGETKSYYFQLEEAGSLSIAVTPCASSIVFNLTRKPLPDGKEGEDLQENDPFIKDIFSTQLKHTRSTSVRVREFKGGGRMVYFDQDAKEGIYILELNAINSDTTVKLLGTTRLHAGVLFPQLPADPGVNVTAKSKRTIAFTWQAAINSTEQRRELEYCLSVSRVRNFQSHCSALAHLRGDTSPTPPPHSGFGFSWEKSRRREMARKARPVKAVSPGKLYYKCIGSKTSYIFDKAKPGRKYFIDIFVVDRQTNRSSTYKGLVVKVDRRKRKSRLKLGNEERKTITLHKGVRSESVRFVLKRDVKRAVLELKACRGTLPFELLHNNTLIHKSEVRRIKIVRIKNLPAGTYIVRFKGKRKRKRSVTVYFTSDSAKYRPPRLPVEHKIKVFRELTTCTNVTLAWMGNDVKQKYCLYKKEISSNDRVRKHRCSDPDHRKKSERVFCTRFRNRDPRKAVVTKTVTGLKPGTLYLFDVYVSRGRSASLVYRNQQVRTNSQC